MRKQISKGKIRIDYVFEMLGILVITNVLDLALTSVGVDLSTIIAINILGIVAVALRTQSRIYSLIYAATSVITFEFFFVEPVQSVNINKEYVLNFFVFLIVALVISSVSAELKISSEERRRAEQEVEREKLRADILRGVGHDLRTPLTGIIGNASLLMEEDTILDTMTRKELAQDIADDAKWLRNLVENMLTITRISDASNGKIDLKLEYELLGDIVDEAIKHVDRRISEHEFTVDCRDVLLAKIDSRIFIQIIINLVNNAIKYTPAGSHISVEAFKIDTLEGSKIVLRVSDDGPGVKDEDKEHIFEKFVSANKRDGDAGRGMGLGLALCKQAVELHNGTIVVRDKIPHGAVFEIELPAVEIGEGI